MQVYPLLQARVQIHASMYDPWCVAAVINDWTSRARQTGVHAAGMQQPGTNFEKCRGFYRLTPVRKSSSSTPPFGGKARDRGVFFFLHSEHSSKERSASAIR